MFRDVPVTSELLCGKTMPVLGRTQYFLGEVVLTCRIPRCNPFDKSEVLGHKGVPLYNMTMSVKQPSFA